MTDTFTHETTIDEIDVSIEYVVTYWGCPEQGPSYASGGEPAEGPEIEVLSVKTAFGLAPSWVADKADTWAHEHIDELVTDAGDELQGRQDADAEARAAR